MGLGSVTSRRTGAVSRVFARPVFGHSGSWRFCKRAPSEFAQNAGDGTVLKKRLLHAIGSLLVIAAVLLFSPRVFVGDTDTARNYLSTIVSSLSTILALCISIILVAIQLTASRYTHRVLDLFLKLPFNISLMLFYFVTIIQSLFLLSRISEPIRETLPAYLQPQMSADMILVVFCFVILIAYMYDVMRLLNPERIVAEIEREFAVAQGQGRDREALDKVLQICDIAKRAAAEMDSTTGTVAVHALANMAERGADRTRSGVTRQFIEIAAIAAKEREGSMVGSVLGSLYSIGVASVVEGRMEDARDVVRALERIVRTGLLSQHFLHFIEEVSSEIYSLASIALSNAETGPGDQSAQFCAEAFQSLAKIGDEVLTHEPGGRTYVARAILSEGFGELAEWLSARESQRETAFTLLIEYGRLARRLIAVAELSDLAAITRWLRFALEKRETERDGIVPMMVAVLLVMLADHAGRPDAKRFFARAIAGRHAWSDSAERALAERSSSLRALFDDEDPGDYLADARDVWAGYRADRGVAKSAKPAAD